MSRDKGECCTVARARLTYWSGGRWFTPHPGGELLQMRPYTGILIMTTLLVAALGRADDRVDNDHEVESLLPQVRALHQRYLSLAREEM